MLHAVTLNYIAPAQALAAQLDAHKEWLVEGFTRGLILFAGPLNNGKGGYILFHADSAEDVNAFLQRDPFVIDKLVDCEQVSLDPLLRAADFPARWAGAARVV
ncbi:YciI family protein [Enterobacter sp. ENT03]|uniref:YciI family protein n=1 Tax=Enterobacter sp. ENT03 TaxID=2854780 RepID=UPI001C487198|nr:YciI family protein [Enterobacter sp. ENT03]MBV7406137.1 hypothetical protein [Enterobacter sp. ENT03]